MKNKINMTPVQILEFHIDIETRHLNMMHESYYYTAKETYHQTILVSKLKQILQEIKEQEND